MNDDNANVADEVLPAQFNELAKAIISALQELTGKSCTSEDIINELKKLLAEPAFRSFNKPALRDRIDKLIIWECEEHCSIHLSEEDLHVLWD